MTTKPQSTTETLEVCPCNSAVPLRIDRIEVGNWIQVVCDNCGRRGAQGGSRWMAEKLWNQDRRCASAAPMVKDDVLNDWLKPMCNRLRYGKCTTLYCLRRGGYTGEPADASIATCEAYEAYNALAAAAVESVEQQADRQGFRNHTPKCARWVIRVFNCMLYDASLACTCAATSRTPAAAATAAPGEQKQPLPDHYLCIAPDEQPAVINFLRGFGTDADKAEAERHLHLCLRCQELANAAPVEQSDSLLAKITQIADIGSAEEFGDAVERLRTIRKLIATTNEGAR